MHRPGYYPYRVVVGPPFQLTYKASPRKEYFLGLVFNTGLLLALGDNEEPAAFKLSSEYIFHQYDGPRSRGSAFSASGYKSAQPESTSGRLSNVDPPLFNFPLSFPVILNDRDPSLQRPKDVTSDSKPSDTRQMHPFPTYSAYTPIAEHAPESPAALRDTWMKKCGKFIDDTKLLNIFSKCAEDKVATLNAVRASAARRKSPASDHHLLH